MCGLWPAMLQEGCRYASTFGCGTEHPGSHCLDSLHTYIKSDQWTDIYKTGKFDCKSQPDAFPLHSCNAHINLFEGTFTFHLCIGFVDLCQICQNDRLCPVVLATAGNAPIAIRASLCVLQDPGSLDIIMHQINIIEDKGEAYMLHDYSGWEQTMRQLQQVLLPSRLHCTTPLHPGIPPDAFGRCA